MEIKKTKVAIIGLGQVGGSLGKALKFNIGQGDGGIDRSYHITGIDKTPSTLKKAIAVGAADEVSQSLSAAKDADIIIICTPVDTILLIYKSLLKIAKPSAIITDAGSVKELGIKSSSIPFIGSHPMAGREKNGIESSDANMYKGAKVVITNADKRLLKKQKQIEDLWKAAGSEIMKLSSKEHDNIVALTSHLPHIISFALNKIYRRTEKRNSAAASLAAGSFKSMTRVAVSSADMWAPIFQMNSKNINKYLKAFIKELKIFEKNLNDKNKLKRKILETQKRRVKNNGKQ